MTSFVGFPKDAYDFSASDVGQALAGLIARDSAGLPKAGWLAAPQVSAVPASWKVEVSRGTYVDHESGAIRFSGLSEAEQLDIEPSLSIPAGQSRIDRIVWNPATDDLSVLAGTPAVSPVAPAAGVLASVAVVRVKAGDGMVLAAQVTPDLVKTALVSARVAGTAAHPAGGALLVAGIYRSTANHRVDFASPFEGTPNLLATGIANGAQVAQWVQVYGLSRTGFNFRILSIGQAPQAGTVRWEAWED